MVTMTPYGGIVLPGLIGLHIGIAHAGRREVIASLGRRDRARPTDGNLEGVQRRSHPP